MHLPTSESNPCDDNTLERRLEDARRELLDLSLRNRLLNTPRHRSRSSSLEIVDERSEQVHRLLVVEGRPLTFLAQPDPIATDAPMAPSPASGQWEADDLPWEGDDAGAEVDPLPQPGDDPVAGEPHPRHVDRRLLTVLTTEKLQARLLRLYYDARTYQEEQGVNILYLALGFLRWYEADDAGTARDAPLLLVPVELERPSANSRFRLRWSGGEVSTNLSLQAKLRAEFGLELPEVLETEDLSPETYFDSVVRAIETRPRWEVRRDDAVLWFFSFAKLLMYRDLDPDNWPEDRPLADRPLLRPLLGGGFEPGEPIGNDDDFVDTLLDPGEAIHVMDADSSQSLAIEEVRRGRNLIIQGPPGTGKSQTITNLIAAAVHEGRRVLFVAEKAAALDVVKSRLDRIGLGDLCLELHSNKARKREVLDQLGRTLSLARPVVKEADETNRALGTARDRLNEHCDFMHAPDGSSGLTPYEVVGQLAALRAPGHAPPEHTFDGAGTWSASERAERLAVVEELAAVVRDIGTPAAHPWRGVMLDALLPMDRDRLVARLPEILSRLDDLESAGIGLADRLDAEPPGTVDGGRALANVARRIAAAPPMDRAALAHDVWARRRGEIGALVEAGVRYAGARQHGAGIIVEAGWQVDAATMRRDLAAHGRSPLRMLSGAYRRARAGLRGILVDRPPRRLADRLAICDAIVEASSARSAIDAASELGADAFGDRWRRVESDWESLAALEAWDRACCATDSMPETFRAVAAALEDPAALTAAADGLEQAADVAGDAVQELFAAVDLDTLRAFGDASVGAVPLGELASRVAAWRDRPDDVARWITWRRREERAAAAGLGPLADRLADGRLQPGDAPSRFTEVCFEAVLRRLWNDRPELAAFNGLSHERVLDSFRRLDRDRIGLARAEVALAHYQRVPRGAGSIGEIGVIRHELKKRRRHLPIRQLLRRAGSAAAAIKPVFMMSPLSVAQYLEPGALDFDLLVIDEASQVRPIDALGAVARARQIVVVGDERQLPPTQFFVKSLDDVEPKTPGDQAAGDLESILGLCSARGMGSRMLRWHYRSRHHSLIAVSNRAFYDDRLYVIPSPAERDDELGLRYHHVDGVFDRGGTATNRAEAAAVAHAVLEHARACPDQSLGVGTFSIRQRDAVLDEIERLRRAHPESEAFFAPGREEPFFVKNLENIQGDERDVIFISVGYGRDADGKLTMHFGPVSNEGGERRLNVLITRARRRCEVFSALTHEDIDPARATGRGPGALREFLAYAQSGRLDHQGEAHDPRGGVLESTIGRALHAHGFESEAHVGVAGVYVGLAVRDPERSDRYLLGVELDGAGYRAARSARDRDRLREQVLTDRGWAIHRLWATDFFNHPDDQLARLKRAVDEARARSAALRAVVHLEHAIEREDEGDAAPGDEYVEASFEVSADEELHEMVADRLVPIVRRIVEIEGPVHEDEIVVRVRTLFGLGRAGRRVREGVAAAIEQATRAGAMIADGPFLVQPGDEPPRVRDRSAVASSTLRSPAMLPPSEIRTAVATLVRAHIGATWDEIVIAVARAMGFRSTSAQLRERIEAEIEAMVESRQLHDVDGVLRAV